MRLGRWSSISSAASATTCCGKPVARAPCALQEAAAPPNLILLDLLLPDIAGEEVYAAVDAHPDWGAIPFIVMSGLSTGAARGSLLPRGVYIQKPFDPADLLALVTQYCGQTK